LFFDISMNEIVSAIENYKPANNRSQVSGTRENVLICDSYNANPSSMKAALDSFSDVIADNKMIILGDMLELGIKSEEEHNNLLSALGNSRFDKVLLVGPAFLKAAASSGFRTFKDVDELIVYLKKEQYTGYTIFIKGSRGIGLEKVYDLL
jgi:UDP-N-acetylmuramoyl-tripeptide--D-alanyl-D-alanine ligase